MRYLLIIFVILTLSACTQGQTTSVPKNDGPGSVLTGRSEQGISLSDVLNRKNNSANQMPINALLWRASLDIASSIPLGDIDTFGGTVVTEWYQLDENSNERIKLAIFVLDRELRSDGIRVVVYVQKRDANEWRDEGTDIEMGARLEELILTRAREIRASTISETN